MKGLFSVLVLIATTASAELKIIGGNEAPVGQSLYVASLRRSAGGAGVCGGTLIAPNVILTAAHCTGKSPPLTHASIGSHFLSGSNDGEQIRIVKEIKHPKFNPATLSYDFAVLILERDSTFGKVKISYDAVPAAATSTIVRGWGFTNQLGSPSQTLQQVSVDTVSNEVCAASLKKKVDVSMLCAGGKAGKDSCQGDSGGPLTTVINNTESLVGVVSWGVECGEVGKPGVYSRISQARDFIEPYTKSSATVPNPTTTKKATPTTKTPTPKPAPTPSQGPCDSCDGCWYPASSHCYPAEYGIESCEMFADLGMVWCGKQP
ncbi:hypothetical protein DYB37_006720 [Aphanomyces astaci]|uniref:Peptidase S1 domain-containing protein n=1 Tax=Aphanomyces astaci TaxID=112090 RepID=A0A3R6XL79_APHAT|nr:hypothetical protein DYB35_010533 [Aphanomyces astaci]RHZ06714.1 hypothetical protein DYB37_006720 [Aphanomyces astaci]